MRPVGGRHARERGTALVLAMLMIAALAVTTQSIVVSARGSVDAGLLERGRSEALAAADGGVALARHRLAADPLWPGEQPRIGRSTVEIRAAPTADGRHRLRVVAVCPVRGAGQPVRAVVDLILVARPDALPSIEAWRERGAD